MAHVLVGNGDQIVERMVVDIVEYEGHAVTQARSSAEILAVLRGSLHPLVVVLFFEGVTADDLPHLLETAWTDRDMWASHAYILCAWWSVPHGSLLEQRIADLSIPVLSCPFPSEQLVTLVEEAAGRTGGAK